MKKETKIYIKETDISTIKRPNNFNMSMIMEPKKGPNNVPILIVPQIKPIKWYQFWRYKDRPKYKAEIERCKNEFETLFGTIDNINNDE